MSKIPNAVAIAIKGKLSATRKISHLIHEKAKVLYSENGLFAVEKPANILSHPNKPEDIKKSIIQGLYNSSKETFEITTGCGLQGEVVYLINRLDSATSGILLMTTDAIIAKNVKNLFAQREVNKVYKAIVFCDRDIEANEKSVFWEDAMQVKRINGKNRAKKSHSFQPTGSYAKTDVTISEPKLYGLGRTKSSGKDMMLLELRPKTGYTHQLRYQCALHDFPIVGDKTYGNFKLNRSSEVMAKAHVATLCEKTKSELNNGTKLFVGDSSSKSEATDFKRLFLHSYSIEFKYECNGQIHNFRAISKLPADFIRIIDNSYSNFS